MLDFLQTYKPDSVLQSSLYHLSSLRFTPQVHQPTLRVERATLYRTNDAPVYLTFHPIRFIQLPKLPPKLVSSYLTFSPLPPQKEAVIFCDTSCTFLRKSFPLGSMVLYVARTFLCRIPTAIERFVRQNYK